MDIADHGIVTPMKMFFSEKLEGVLHLATSCRYLIVIAFLGIQMRKSEVLAWFYEKYAN